MCFNLVILLFLSAKVYAEYEHVFTTYVNATVLQEKYPEDYKSNVTFVALKYGYKAEEHTIMTEDGYLITVFRVSLPSKKTGKPLFVLHGIMDSSDTWFLRGKESIGFLFADAGFDVWFGNCRGNRYGRRHVTLEPDRHAQFWNYSYHDIGFYDIPASVDYILQETNQTTLKIVGQSQGTTVMYVLLSTRPEYNQKVDIVVSLAPISYVHNASGPLVPVIIAFIVTFNSILNLFGQHELMGDGSIPHVLMQYICFHYPEVCANKIILPLAGYSTEQIEIEFYRYAIGKYPSGTTRKNFLHLSQNRIQRRFAKFDYGISGNFEVYNSMHSPVYNLSKITTKIGLICSKNDGLSSLKDVDLLRKQLPNVVEYFVIPNAEWMHADFLWGRGIYKVVMPKILDMLNTT